MIEFSTINKVLINIITVKQLTFNMINICDSRDLFLLYSKQTECFQLKMFAGENTKL